MKKALSYLWPLTKKISSTHSGTLEVTWLNGKKVLDSKNANYSYGSLERVLDFGLSHTKADRNSEILVLGLGGGSVLSLLRKKYKYSGKITAVEIDPEVIKIAENEFRIQDHAPLELICEDALKFVEHTSTKYGLIIIDIFIDIKVPLQFYSPGFWQNIPKLLNEDGTVLFNAGIHSANEEEIFQLTENPALPLTFRKLENVHGTNTLLLGTKKPFI